MATQRRKKGTVASWKPPMSSDAVKAKTGRGWDEWFAIIDRARGTTLGHKGIVTLLYEKNGVPGWWCQMITVGYEQARGLRAKHEKADGFEVSASRTIDVDARRVFKAFRDERERARWLPDAAIVVHKATPYKSARATWTDGSKSIAVGFYPQGAGKTIVSVQHGKLKSASEGARMKAFWGKRLDGLKALLER